MTTLVDAGKAPGNFNAVSLLLEKQSHFGTRESSPLMTKARQVSVSTIGTGLAVEQQVFHRILDFKHGPDVYPGLFA